MKKPSGTTGSRRIGDNAQGKRSEIVEAMMDSVRRRYGNNPPTTANDTVQPTYKGRPTASLSNGGTIGYKGKWTW
jgi:hypothetical protein